MATGWLSEQLNAALVAIALKFNEIKPRLMRAGGEPGQVLKKSTYTDFQGEWADVREIPAGGSQGQYLRKTSALDFAVGWTTITGTLPTGGTVGMALTKSGAGDFQAAWNIIGVVPQGGLAGQVLRKTSSAKFATEWGTPAEVPVGGTTGQILRKASATNFDAVWADAPAGSNLIGVPAGWEAGQVLTAISATAISWRPPAGGGGGSSGGSTSKVIRGFVPNKFSEVPDPTNFVGIPYSIVNDYGTGVRKYSSIFPVSFLGPSSSNPNLMLLGVDGGQSWRSMYLFLGEAEYYQMPAYLKGGQFGSWKGVSRFTLEQINGQGHSNFFTGVVGGPTATSGAVRGWGSFDGSQFSGGVMAGLGFEWNSQFLEFVYSLGSEVIRIPTAVPVSALTARMLEARFELNAERSHLSTTLVSIPDGEVLAGPELLALSQTSQGYTMTIGRGTSAFSDYEDSTKYVGVVALTMETDY